MNHPMSLRNMVLRNMAWIALACAAIATGCQSEKRFELRGKVMDKNLATNEIIVQHGDIPGFMPAMTMPYKVKDPSVVQELEPGDSIAAEVVTTNGGSDYWLDSVRITDESGRKSAKPASVPRRLEIGEQTPDFRLTNQDGKTLRFSDFRGKALLVTFVYTRCPSPTFCPRLSSQFARIHADFSKTPKEYSNMHLLSITMDPKYDTAPVLRKYGLAYLDNDPSGFAHWDFASTSPSDLRKLADAFGLEYFEDGNQIAHTMVIVLIGADGRVARYWATEWTTAELEGALRQEAETSTTFAPAGAKEVTR